MAPAEAPFPNYPGWPTAQQTDEKDLHLKARSKTVISSVFACKLKALANSRGSYSLADMETSDNTLDRYKASLSDRLTVFAVDSINRTCTYYNTVNKRILITANKRIHITSAYFLAAASNKRMRLLTSLYGNEYFRHDKFNLQH